MIVRGRECSKMPCESCAVQFSVFKRKRACSECERYYCSGCLRRGGGICSACRVLTTRPLVRQSIAHLKIRDLQCFLQRQNVSTRGCVEKEELLNLCVSHVNSAAYRRRGARSASSPFSSLKGLTTNINEFINSAFDLRNPAHPQPPSNISSCLNASHVHASTNGGTPGGESFVDRRFTTTPGGERDIRVPVPEPSADAAGSAGAEAERARVDTTDCFEIEDLVDTGWEFVTRPPADPLPNDSEMLLLVTERSAPGDATPQRAASELELHRSESVATALSEDTNETISLHEETFASGGLADDSPKHITLDKINNLSELELLSAKQLKELLSRNRVEFRGCLERKDLLERAKMLWQDHASYRDQLDKLPIEDSCKICMAAPLECVLLECGHIAACTDCSKQLAECPICRQYVVRAVRFFRS